MGVGGLDAQASERKLAAGRAGRPVPVAFTAGEKNWPIAPAQIALRADWAEAVQEALDKGDGPCRSAGSSACS